MHACRVIQVYLSSESTVLVWSHYSHPTEVNSLLSRFV